VKNLVTSSLSSAGGWAAGRARDAALWPVNLLRDLPGRLDRLGQTVIDGASGLRHALPEGLHLLGTQTADHAAERAAERAARSAWLRERAAGGAYWFLGFGTRLFDLAGGPELGEFLLHLGTHAGPLTQTESAAARAVLGPGGERWGEVRVAQGGVLGPIFRRNGGRAFTTWHTINMPSDGHSARTNLEIVVHELTHVLQYERAGTIYMVEALRAQATAENYDYGKLAGLQARLKANGRLADLNREQQASIAQDYFRECVQGAATCAADELAELRRQYRPWIEELRAKRV
jgi:hypothetical protein